MSDIEERLIPRLLRHALSNDEAQEIADEIARLKAEIADMKAARDLQRASIRHDVGRPA